LKCGPGEGVEI